MHWLSVEDTRSWFCKEDDRWLCCMDNGGTSAPNLCNTFCNQVQLTQAFGMFKHVDTTKTPSVERIHLD